MPKTHSTDSRHDHARDDMRRVQADPSALAGIPLARWTDELKETALSLDGLQIKRMANPSVALQLLAVRQNPFSVACMHEPAAETRRAAYRADPYALNWIHMPSKAERLECLSVHGLRGLGAMQFFLGGSDNEITPDMAVEALFPDGTYQNTQTTENKSLSVSLLGLADVLDRASEAFASLAKGFTPEQVMMLADADPVLFEQPALVPVMRDTLAALTGDQPRARTGRSL